MIQKRPLRIAAVTTCHNRRSLTLNALDTLSKQSTTEHIALQTFLVDDGSTDGTADAVRARFPAATIIPGNGNLFWNQGMRAGIRKAKQVRPDFFLLFNDDTHFESNALEQMIRTHRHHLDHGDAGIVVGAIRDPDTGTLAYGGFKQVSNLNPLKLRKIPHTGSVEMCDTFNMNSVLVSSVVLHRLGNLERRFHHTKGDLELGLRAKRKGFRACVTAGYIGSCPHNSYAEVLQDRKKSRWSRFRFLLSLRSHKPLEQVVLYRRHGGPLWPVFALTPYVDFLLQELGWALGRLCRTLHRTNHQ